MAEGDDAEDKNFAPSARRLQQARDEGQVPLSRELPALTALGTGLVVMMMAGPAIANALTLRLQAMLASAGSWEVGPQGTLGPIRAAGLAWLLATAPLTLAVLAAGFFAVVAQVGVLIRPQALAPDFSRIDPRAGFKRLFGLDNLLEAVKSILKIGFVGYAGWGALAAELPLLPSATAWQSGHLLGRMVADVQHLLLLMLAAQVAIAALDLVWVRFRHNKRLRMTREDVRQETRETEGSPETKQRIRRIRMARARKRMLLAVPKAMVVVTNPTHYAIALAYDRARDSAPKVVAKGVDSVAERIREIARENRVPLVANPPLARALYQVELDQEIPAEHFQAVAGIIAYVWRLQGKMAGRPGGAVR